MIRGDKWHTELYVVGDSRFKNGTLPDIYLSKMGHFVSEGGFFHDQVVRDIAIHIVASGRGKVSFEHDCYEVGPGDVFVFFPDQHIHYYDFEKTPWHYTWFMLKGVRAADAVGLCGFSAGQPYRAQARTRATRVAIEYASDVLSGDYVSPLVSAEVALRILNSLSVVPSGQSMSIVDQAMALFDQHDGSFLGVDELARILQISRTTLFRAFRQELGRSPKEVFGEMRLRQAQTLLRFSHNNIKTIASICGYRNAAYFNRVFKSHVGMPPGAWRQAGQVDSQDEARRNL
jgi:AraC-like DNA-binding protein